MWDVFNFIIKPESIQETIQLLFSIDVSLDVCVWISRFVAWGCVVLVLYIAVNNIFLKGRKKRKAYIQNKIPASFVEYSSRKFSRHFIETRFQSLPPNIYADILDSIHRDSTQTMLPFYVNNVLVESNTTEALYCVLGGSGMGKTSFMVNLLKRYVNNYKFKDRPYEIELINLADENYKSLIDKIERKNETILLLDALDENAEAVSNYECFKNELEGLIKDFRFVIISCRTQFFPDEEHEIKESKIKSNGRNKGFNTYTRHYISPFSDDEVKRYLKKLFPLNIRKRLQARNIVKQCSSFAHRPLLLSYIEDLLSDKNFHYTDVQTVYERLIQKWIDREVARMDNRENMGHLLLDFSQKLAVEMYRKYEEKGGYCLSPSEVDEIYTSVGVNKVYEYKGRSLINRDAQGIYKFSHKSFLEYFLAKEYFENEDFPLNFNGLDSAKMLFTAMCQKYLDKCGEIGKIEIKKSDVLVDLYDTIIVYTPEFHAFRYLEFFENIKILVLKSKYVMNVVGHLEKSNIEYIIIADYKFGDSINLALNRKSIKYVNIIGDNCTISLLKEARRTRTAIINNDELMYVPEDINVDEMPLDFAILWHKKNESFIPFSFIRNTRKK